MTYFIEVVPLGSTPAELLEDVCNRLNAVQKEFNFDLPPARIREDGTVFIRQNYFAQEVFNWLADFRARAKGNHPYLIAFVQGSLQSDEHSNLFGSSDAEKAVAVVTLHDHTNYVSSTRAYVAYYLLRYAIGFIAPSVKSHEATLGCFFDFKGNKYHLRKSLLEGKFCDDCMRKLQKAALTPEIVSAIQAIATLIRNLELRPEGETTPAPAPTPTTSTTGTPAPPQTNRDDEHRGRFPWGNAILSLVALAVGIAVILLLQGFSKALGNTLLYFAGALILSLAASLVVFGVLRGYANYKGKVYNGTLELGGSAAMFILILVLAYKLQPAAYVEPTSPQPSTFNISVKARDEKQRPVTTGRLLMTVGQETKPAVLNNDGEGTFKEISSTYRGDNASVEAQVPQYVLREPNKVYKVAPSVITVELQWHPDDPLEVTRVFAAAGKYPAETLVQTLVGSAEGVVVAPELATRLKRKRVTLQAPMLGVPLKKALDQIFAQIGFAVVYDRKDEITTIRSKSGGSK